MKQFRRDISRELVTKTLVEKRRNNISTPSPIGIKKGKPTISPSIRTEQSAHQPERSTRRRCTLCSTKQDEVRTNWMCSICKVPLCLGKNKTNVLYNFIEIKSKYCKKIHIKNNHKISK